MAKAKSLKDIKLPIRDFTPHSDYDRVISWYLDDTDTVKLSPREEVLRDRMDYCDNLIRKYGARSRVITLLQKKYPDISKKTAATIYNKTQLAFGSIGKFTKDYWRDVVVEMAAETRELALLKGNLSVAAECLKIIGKFKRLDKEDIMEDDRPQLPQTVIIQQATNTLGLVSLSEEEARKVLEEVLKPKLKHNYSDPAEEVEFVEDSGE